MIELIDGKTAKRCSFEVSHSEEMANTKEQLKKLIDVRLKLLADELNKHYNFDD